MAIIKEIQESAANGIGGLTPEAVSPSDETEISKTAELLFDRHGRDADLAAALGADALFRHGNTIEATRWLGIFRRIALSHLSRAPQR